MRILLTNDDGIRSPGLSVLQQIASELGDDVWVVAPESDQSGVSHSLTLHEPLRCHKNAEKMFSVRGTPTDCVIMAIRHLMVDELPDLVLSGVNRGQNTADEVTYSGTIAGAIEGTILGIPSIALSLASDSLGNSCKLYWETPLALGSKVVKNLLETGWPEGVFLNINFPACPPESVGNVVITRQGQRNQALIHIEDRMDTRGDPYYWLGYERSKIPPPAGTDLDAIGSGNISVTPLSLDLTDNAALHLLRSRSS